MARALGLARGVVPQWRTIVGSAPCIPPPLEMHRQVSENGAEGLFPTGDSVLEGLRRGTRGQSAEDARPIG